MVAYLLFYSNKCRYSHEFIKKLETIPQLNFNFKKICIDKRNGILRNEVRQAVSAYNIRGVPSIVVDGNVLLGGQADGWLNSQMGIPDSRFNQLPTIVPSLNKQDYSQLMRAPDYQHSVGSIQHPQQHLPSAQPSGLGGLGDDYSGTMPFGQPQGGVGLDGMRQEECQNDDYIIGPNGTMIEKPQELRAINCGKGGGNDTSLQLDSYEKMRNQQLNDLRR